MLDPLGSATSGLFKCPHCGSRYAVSLVQLVEMKKGQAKCAVCDRTMSEWNETVQPNYTLVERNSGEAEK
jgi:predicted Zn finger-like uncharacterized protein